MLKRSALEFFSVALAISSCDRLGDGLGDADKDPDRLIERESSGDIPDHLACVDEGRPDFNPEALQHPGRPRKVRPTAGALADATIADHSRFQAAAYAMYRAFDAGEDPRSAFPRDDLNLEALIYGEPGPQTERPRAPARSRTLYGFVAAPPSARRGASATSSTSCPPCPSAPRLSLMSTSAKS